jgi:hypothetical protein
MIHDFICIVGVERKMRGLGSTHLLTGGWERIPMPRELVKTLKRRGATIPRQHRERNCCCEACRSDCHSQLVGRGGTGSLRIRPGPALSMESV